MSLKAPLRILHLEDDPNDAELVNATLSSEAIVFDMTCVDSREEYAAALNRGGFDLILSDFKIPSFDGFSALEIAKQYSPEIPFIFVSATIGEDRAIDAVQLGATDYVLKDRLARLGPAVRRALAETAEHEKRMEAERRLRESEEQFRLITENMADLVAVLDLEGKRLYNSPSYATLLGSPESLRGTDSFTEVHPDDRQRISKVFDETVRTGKGQRTEYRLSSKDNKVRFIESQGSVITDSNGNPANVIVVSRDVTDRKKLEAELLHAQKMESIGTLAGGIAHDFNNVLGIIIGYLSLINRKNVKPEDFARAVEAMTTAVQRGASLVRQLLTFARKTEVLYERMNVNATVEEVAKMCSQTFPKTIVFSTIPDLQIPAIIGDRNQLHQALLNLCVNARDAMPNGGALSITTSIVAGKDLRSAFPDAEYEQYIHVAVADTGTGMDEVTQAHIFEAFFTTKEIGKGTGLGLAMVYGVINSHKGHISVKSEIGHGTIFSLYFPVPPPGVTSLTFADAPAQEVAGGNETILFAEDEDTLVELVKTLLEAKGYRVLIARDGLQAVDLFKQHADEIALVITDIGLPKLNGMKAIRPKITTIVATGYLDAKQRSEMLKAGAKDIVQKPFVPNLLLRKVREVLDSVKTCS
ncbi:MAG: hybrid sensor histidine kinase/response regulator [Bacteroidetes bacterium]|nr:hybrid sensor histidine kinase/response regulator [Bacteroidota bacterium]